jgi:hypothetical protein
MLIVRIATGPQSDRIPLLGGRFANRLGQSYLGSMPAPDSSPPRQCTLAFHFRYIMPGEWLDSNQVAILLLAQLLRVVRPGLKTTGNLLVRMGKLIYTQDLDGPLGTALRDSHIATSRRRFCRGQQCELTEYLVPLDRIFVITVSGRVNGFQLRWSKQLRRHVRHPFLFSLEVNVDDRAQEIAYLKQATVVGELQLDGCLQLEFDSIEFEPNLSTLLDRMGMRNAASVAAMRTALGILEKPLKK